VRQLDTPAVRRYHQTVRERSFTVEQANAHVRRLDHLIERVQRSALRLRNERDAVAGAFGVEPAALAVDRLLAERPGLRLVVEELDAAIAAIEQLGVELKDVELGLVDFPATLDGEAVYLCWQFGEDRVRYWHRRTEGFGGRRPLPGVPPAPAPQ
jgi:hypothetical protein